MANLTSPLRRLSFPRWRYAALHVLPGPAQRLLVPSFLRLFLQRRCVVSDLAPHPMFPRLLLALLIVFLGFSCQYPPFLLGAFALILLLFLLPVVLLGMNHHRLGVGDVLNTVLELPSSLDVGFQPNKNSIRSRNRHPGHIYSTVFERVDEGTKVLCRRSIVS
ncbi:hypothetical protein CC80DRAFT_324437 [Byssothecium circinans]|uniref:Uncharacterized protein n=1 Tax=Byssothecium circinans TaxID=147558 RepID=A0A6A5U4K7_9PLEO|nr:hypothetical protein CC80DRAFT_324437 [Byssothecium circinans]